jgi:DNA-binding beta-propeller fold protein YncE
MSPFGRLTAGLLLALAGPWSAAARAAPAAAPPLTLERTIPLAGSGRIDHLAFDPAKGRLFVAELGAGAVEAVEVATGRSLGRIGGLKEPQGLAYLPGRDELVVATGGDGAVRFYRAADLKLLATVRLGDDADNVRVDPRSGRVVVGYGGGALAVIEPATRAVVRTIPLPAHPESFQLVGDRAFVNVPNAGGVAVVGLDDGRRIARWPNPGAQLNFPMAVDRERGSVAVVYRLPGVLALFRSGDGGVVQKIGACGDSDDLFLDAKRRRLYAVCGSGSVDVFDSGAAGVVRIARIATPRGAPTGLSSPDADRLFVAARAGPKGPAAILVYRPAP